MTAMGPLVAAGELMTAVGPMVAAAEFMTAETNGCWGHRKLP
jgi:hypothetical protein